MYFVCNRVDPQYMNTKKQRSKYQKKQRVIILLDGVFDLRNVFYKVLWNEHSGGRMIPIPICTLLGYKHFF